MRQLAASFFFPDIFPSKASLFDSEPNRLTSIYLHDTIFRLDTKYTNKGGTTLIRSYLFTMLPAVLAFAFSGVYAIVDGFFVGQYIGDSGLAGINIAYPMTALLQAVGTGIGMGGSIHMSISLGRGEDDQRQRFLGTTVSMLFLATIVLFLILWPLHPHLLRLFGATGAVYDCGLDYIRMIILGTAFQVFSTGLAPVFRNLNRSLFAMCAMMAGFITNIVLDAVMISVWDMGMIGAGLATILGQGVTAILCLIMLIVTEHDIPRKLLIPQGWAVSRIITTGISPFGLTMSPNLVIMLVNLAAVRHGGELAVAAYAVVSYVAVVIQLILQGVGDGSQPTMSLYFGERRIKDLHFIRKLAYGIGLGLSIGFSLLTVFRRAWFPAIFGSSPEAASMVGHVLCIIAIGYPAIAIVRVTIAYFYSINLDRFAYVMVYGESIIMAITLLILPHFFGLEGVWIATPAVQILMACTALVFRYLAYKKVPKQAN